ncbi:transposase family protein [Amycolatopsis lurida]
MWTRHNYAIIDGTVIRIDRVAANKSYFSGKHRYHGINLQALTDPHGQLLWLSDGLPGAINDTAAAPGTTVSASRQNRPAAVAGRWRLRPGRARGDHPVQEPPQPPPAQTRTSRGLPGRQHRPRPPARPGERGFATLKTGASSPASAPAHRSRAEPRTRTTRRRRPP